MTVIPPEIDAPVIHVVPLETLTDECVPVMVVVHRSAADAVEAPQTPTPTPSTTPAAAVNAIRL